MEGASGSPQQRGSRCWWRRKGRSGFLQEDSWKDDLPHWCWLQLMLCPAETSGYGVCSVSSRLTSSWWSCSWVSLLESDHHLWGFSGSFRTLSNPQTVVWFFSHVCLWSPRPGHVLVSGLRTEAINYFEVFDSKDLCQPSDSTQTLDKALKAEESQMQVNPGSVWRVKDM